MTESMSKAKRNRDRYSHILAVVFTVEDYNKGVGSANKRDDLPGATKAATDFATWVQDLRGEVVNSKIVDVRKEDIDKGLVELRERIRVIQEHDPDARIAVLGYFAGHGERSEAGQTVFRTRTGEYAIKQLVTPEIADLWLVGAHHVLWIFDCCNAAGALSTAASGVSRTVQKFKADFWDQTQSRLAMIGNDGVQMLSASGNNQSAWFTAEGSKFLNQLVEAVSNAQSGILPASLAPVSYTHLTLPTICSV